MKGHLTRVINRAEDVTQRADTNPYSYIDKEIKEISDLLDKRLSSVEESYAAVQQQDPDNVQTYERELDAESARHLRAKNRLLAALGRLQGRPLPAAATTTTLLTPTNEVLKPFVLTKDHTPSELRLWRDQLATYCEASNMSAKPHSEQVAYVGQCLSTYLIEKIRPKITRDMPVIADSAQTPSVMGLIETEFAARYPLFTRRMAFFDARQPAGMAFSDWYGDLLKLAREADLESLTPAQNIVFRAIFGTTDQALQKRFFAVQELTLEKIETLVREHEVSQAAMKSLRPNGAMAAAVSQPRGNQDRDKIQRLMQEGKCLRCGKPKDSHEGRKCPAVDLKCHKCGKRGHIAPACFAPSQGGRNGRQQDGAKSRNRSKSRGRPKFKRRSPSRSSSRGSSQGSREGKITAVCAIGGYNKAAEKLLVWLAPQKKPRHGPAATFRYACTADTGASETVMAASLAKKFGLKPDKSLRLRLINASRDKMVVQGGVKMTLTVGGHETTTVVQVTTSLKEGVLICLQDLKNLGVVPHDFPRPQYSGSVNTVKPDETEAINDLLKEYSDVLKTNGDKFPPMKGKPMTIHLREDVEITPHKCLTTRPIPLHMQDNAKKLIDELLDSGVIEKVDGPTEWCHRGFFTPKPGRPTEPRLVVNLMPLNRFVKRPVHPFPSPRNVVKAIKPESRYFAKLDLLHGYFQIELDSASSDLVSFLLPDGVYRFKRAPQGLCSSGDEFCTRSDEALAGLPNVIKLVDDILIQASTMEELIASLKAVFQRCRERQITLARKKVMVGEEVNFAGFTVSADGVRPDPKMVAGIADMAPPTNTSELRSFLGLAQQLTMFTPDLAHMTSPLSALLKKNVAWTWEEDQKRAFELTKKNLTSPLIVKAYDPALPTAILTDASRLKGLGYALVQYEDEKMRLIQCGSRTLTDTESRYATCELEALAILHGITSAKHYLLGRQDSFKVLTDHKPLVGLFKKELSDTTNARILRYREKLANFNFTVEWVPGKCHQIADALSRAPVFTPAQEVKETAQNDTAAICSAISADPLLEELASMAAADKEYQEILHAVREKQALRKLPDGHPAKQFKSAWDQLSTYEDTLVVFDADRLLVPRGCRPKILQQLHASHPGITRMRKSAQALYFWPGQSSDIKNFVESCQACRVHLPSQAHDTPRPYPKTSAPMESVSLDLFDCHGRTHLLMVDRNTFYLWVHHLQMLTTAAVTKQLAKWFQTFGNPKTVVTDSGPQFRSEFEAFCRANGITSVKSSAYNPESNGLAETAVKQMKLLMKKVGTSFTQFEEALAHWRNTPGANDRPLSPSEMLFGRRLRANLPFIAPASAKEDSGSPDNSADRLEELHPGDVVTVQDPHSRRWDRTAKVIRIRPSGRSYDIELEGRTTSRNRRYLKRIPREAPR